MKRIPKIGLLAFVLAGVSATTAMGCAGAPLRTDSSSAGIRAAEEVGATNVPRAALHLQLAKEELEHAQGLAKEGESEKADSLLERAEVDAELAVLLSREESEKSEAMAAVKRVRQLRQDKPPSTQENNPTQRSVP